MKPSRVDIWFTDFIAVVWGVKKVDVAIFKPSALFGNVTIFIGQKTVRKFVSSLSSR